MVGFGGDRKWIGHISLTSISSFVAKYSKIFEALPSFQIQVVGIGTD